MNDLTTIKTNIDQQWKSNGYFIKEQLFSDEEIKDIKSLVKSHLASLDNPNGVHVWWPGKMPVQVENVVCTKRLADLLKEIF